MLESIAIAVIVGLAALWAGRGLLRSLSRLTGLGRGRGRPAGPACACSSSGGACRSCPLARAPVSDEHCCR